VFRPLLEAARYKGAYGGRGFGKSHFFGELMVEECLRVPGTLAVCIRRRLDKARRSTALLNTGLASD
jgi:phage terminase large subunit